jgi:hypothetical protein
MPNADVAWHGVGMPPSQGSGIFDTVSYSHRDFIFKLIPRWKKYTARGINLSCLPRGTLEYKVSFGFG